MQICNLIANLHKIDYIKKDINQNIKKYVLYAGQNSSVIDDTHIVNWNNITEFIKEVT